MKVRIPHYPPLALAAGGPFFAWLFGSLTWDSFSREPRDLVLGIVFGLLFLVIALFTLVAWTDTIHSRRTGLILDANGVRRVDAGWFGLVERERQWTGIRSVSMEKGAVVFDGPDGALRVPTAGLLEGPEWIVDRAVRFLEKGSDQAIAELEAELRPLSCVACGGRIEVPLASAETVACRDCGVANSLPEELRAAIRRLREVVRSIPEAHRHLGRRTLVRLLSRGLSFRQGMIVSSWITAGAFALIAAGGLVSDPEDTGFALWLAAIAATALLLGYGVASATRALAIAYASPNMAVQPLSAGGNACCRLCGGELPGLDVVRRCAYCDTDSVVTGASLAAAETTALDAVREARRLADQSTEAASAVMERVAFALEWLAILQVLWLQVPIAVALDGSYGLLRLTAVCAAITIANLVAGAVSLRWLRRSTTAAVQARH